MFRLRPILSVGSHLCFRPLQKTNHPATFNSQRVLASWNSSEESDIASPTNSTLTFSRFGVGSCHFHQFLEGSFCNGVGGDLFHLLHLLFIATGLPPSGGRVRGLKAERAYLFPVLLAWTTSWWETGRAFFIGFVKQRPLFGEYSKKRGSPVRISGTRHGIFVLLPSFSSLE